MTSVTSVIKFHIHTGLGNREIPATNIDLERKKVMIASDLCSRHKVSTSSSSLLPREKQADDDTRSEVAKRQPIGEISPFKFQTSADMKFQVSAIVLLAVAEAAAFTGQSTQGSAFVGGAKLGRRSSGV